IRQLIHQPASAPEVMLQQAIALAKHDRRSSVEHLVRIAEECGDDPLLPHIVWNNLLPSLTNGGDAFLVALRNAGGARAPALKQIVARALDPILSNPGFSSDLLASFLLTLVNDAESNQALIHNCLVVIAQKLQTGELSDNKRRELAPHLEPVLSPLIAQPQHSDLHREAVLLATSLGMPQAFEPARELLVSPQVSDALRLQALAALIVADDADVLAAVRPILRDAKASAALRRGVIDALGRMETDQIAGMLLDVYAELPAELRPQAIELLTQRPAWAEELVAAIVGKRIAPADVNTNQVLRLSSSKNAALTQQVAAIWGAVRTERNPDREKVIAQMRDTLRTHSGDPYKGQALFGKLCGQCHKIYGQGQEVGPDITANGRASFEQLLSNVFDPSLVIGNAYQARIVVTTDGRTLTGLLAEESPQRVVLKVQGGKLETIPRSQIEEIAVSKLSLMPEGVEKQYQPEEIINLFAFLTLSKPPSDPSARLIPGTAEGMQPATNADQGK
ncbi:MAG TPA: dehydrogenase, partial [Pirellulales bacterium]|nr:dehydrogenase [Pirellulales bacterium]